MKSSGGRSLMGRTLAVSAAMAALLAWQAPSRETMEEAFHSTACAAAPALEVFVEVLDDSHGSARVLVTLSTGVPVENLVVGADAEGGRCDFANFPSRLEAGATVTREVTVSYPIGGGTEVVAYAEGRVAGGDAVAHAADVRVGKVMRKASAQGRAVRTPWGDEGREYAVAGH